MMVMGVLMEFDLEMRLEEPGQEVTKAIRNQAMYLTLLKRAGI